MPLSLWSWWFYFILLTFGTSVTQSMSMRLQELHSATQRTHATNSSDQIVFVNSTSVPFYHLVHYFTQETMQNKPQVYDLNIAQFLYYTHMYFAWMQVEPSLSVVAVGDSPKNTELHGANMALPINALASLYAPGNITNVLAFVRRCYDHVRTKNRLLESAQSFVSTLRTAETEDINRKLITEVTKAFQRMAAPGAYHLLWEDRILMDSFLKKLGYSRSGCSSDLSDSSMAFCNWGELGVNKEKAGNLCIYVLVKPL
ncbi:hypothetical protein D915_001007 [Fasciola hepatica]|uniref:Uncharacterized protein n=1 Tax=Fasciola hepatica TaxID=6192 RepID=A0A4E0RZL0_FASHE|nr:hypothetical protein D915_001007 [Fasciola hepatica]